MRLIAPFTLRSSPTTVPKMIVMNRIVIIPLADRKISTPLNH